MDFQQQTSTRPDDILGRILVGEDFRAFDLAIAESQTIVGGAVLGLLTGTEQFTVVDETVVEETISGDGSATEFDLAGHSVDPASVRVLNTGGADQRAVFDFTINAGAGTGGVDQISFGTAPASGTDNITIRYQRSNARGIGIALEDTTTGVGETATIAGMQAGGVKLSELDSPPASWVAGSVQGQFFIR